jgi:hypothetical protein
MSSSPTLQQRQQTGDYAIHAGRQLFDKEFRSIYPNKVIYLFYLKNITNSAKNKKILVSLGYIRTISSMFTDC